MTLRENLQRKEAIRLELRGLADANPGDMPAEVQARWDALEAEATALNGAEKRLGTLAAMDQRAAGLAPVTGSAETPEVDYRLGLRREQRMADYYAARNQVAVPNLSAGRYIKAMVSGDWRDAPEEKRAAGEAVGTAGGFLLPSLVSPHLVDLLRNRAVLMAAGAVTFPMDSLTLRIVQVVADPTAVLHAESQDDITESQGTFNAVTMTARTVAAIVRVSRELFEDSPTFAAELEVQLAKVLAIQLDFLGLFGGGASQPLGLRNTSGIQTVSMGANGVSFVGTLAPIDNVLAVIQKIEEANATAPTMLWAPRTKAQASVLKDGLGNYFNATHLPDSFNALNKFVSNQVSVTETQGSSGAAASSIFLGDFSNICFGIRNEFRIESSFEAGTASGGSAFGKHEVLFKATMRADFAVLRPYAMGALIGIL